MSIKKPFYKFLLIMKPLYINNFLVSKIIYNLVNIGTNYVLSLFNKKKFSDLSCLTYQIGGSKA